MRLSWLPLTSRALQGRSHSLVSVLSTQARWPHRTGPRRAYAVCESASTRRPPPALRRAVPSSRPITHPPRWVRKSVSSGAPSASPSHLVAFSALNQLPPAPASGTLSVSVIVSRSSRRRSTAQTESSPRKQRRSWQPYRAEDLYFPTSRGRGPSIHCPDRPRSAGPLPPS